MKRVLWTLGILLLATTVGWAQRKEESLGDAARRIRAERALRNLSKVPYFTNDNIPRLGAVTILGGGKSASAAPSGQGETPAAKEDDCDENCWRGKFDAKRKQIAEAERELDLMQRERNLNKTQFYKDPNRALQEQYTNSTSGGKELQDQQKKITDKQGEVERLKRELTQLESELRAAGKPAGWGRPPAQ